MFQCRLVQSMGSLYQSHTTGSVIIARWLRWPLFPIGMRIIPSKIGNTNAALEAYQQSPTIRERLLAQDRQNVEYQRNLILILTSLGTALDAQGKHIDAKFYFQKCLEKQLAMKENGTLQPDYVPLIEEVEQRLNRYN